MNSMPPKTAAPAAEPSGQSARGRVADYDRLVDDLAYAYEGIFSRDSIAQAVADARQALEPTATIPDFLPILVSRFARERLTAAAQADGRLIKPVPELLLSAFKTLAAPRWRPPLRSTCPLAKCMFAPPARSPPTRSIRRLCRSSPSVA